MLSVFELVESDFGETKLKTGCAASLLSVFELAESGFGATKLNTGCAACLLSTTFELADAKLKDA